jgi:ketosteroid isomerase-like protein
MRAVHPSARNSESTGPEGAGHSSAPSHRRPVWLVGRSQCLLIGHCDELRDTARTMSQEDVETAKSGYALLNDAYRSGDARGLRTFLEEFWDPDVVLVPAGLLPESESVRGWDGALQFLTGQMQAFEDGSMWLEPLEYIDAGDRLAVPYRFGGRARHTGIDVEFFFVHVFTQRRGKVVRLDVYQSKEEALEDAGLQE